MPNPADLVAGLVPAGQHLTTTFAVLLLFPVPAGLTCVITGAVAAASPKRFHRHPRFATVYYWTLGIVLLSATGMALLRSSEDRNLFVLGTISFGVGSIGYAARRIRWRGSSFHILGISLSYIVLLTAFFVDDDPHLPLWDRLPALAYWTLPALVGVTLVTRAVRRHTHLTSDLFAARQALRSGIGGSL